MKRLILLLLLCATAFAQRDNTFYVLQFPGSTVGTKATAAQKACSKNTNIPCVLIFDPSLAVYPQGTMPAKCAQCVWNDYTGKYGGVPANVDGQDIKPRSVAVTHDVTAESVTLSGGEYLTIIGSSPTVTATQGYATDGTNHYFSQSGSIWKTDAAYSTVWTNATPFTSLPSGVNHIGDFEYYSGNLYVAAGYYNSGDGVGNKATIAVYKAADGTYVQHADVSAVVPDASAVAVVPSRNSLFVAAYYDGSKLWEFDLTTLDYKGSLPLMRSVTLIQGLSWNEATQRFAISSNLGGSPHPLYLADLSGNVTFVGEGGAAEMEGVDYTTNQLRYLITLDKVYHGVIRQRSAQVLKQPSRRIWTYAAAANTSLASVGDSLTASGTGSNRALDSTWDSPMTINYVSAATAGSAAGVYGKLYSKTLRNPILQAWVQIPSVTDYTNTRVWVGFVTNSPNMIAAGDVPDSASVKYVAFRASTVAGDTNWKCVDDDGTGQEVFDSGIPVSHIGHTFEIRLTPTSIKWFIGGQQVCSSTRNNTFSNLALFVNSMTQENVAKNLRVAYIYTEQDTPQ